jgi:hypothetical protein
MVERPDNRCAECENEPSLNLTEDETLFAQIPKEGAVFHAQEKTNQKDEKYIEYHTRFFSAFDPGKVFYLKGSMALRDTIQRAAIVYKLPQKVAILREGTGQRDTRYSVVRMKEDAQ